MVRALGEIDAAIAWQRHTVRIDAAIAEIGRDKAGGGGGLADARHGPGGPLQEQSSARERERCRIGTAHFDVPRAIGKEWGRDNRSGIRKRHQGRDRIIRQRILPHANRGDSGRLRDLETPADYGQAVIGDRNDDAIESPLIIGQQSAGHIAKAIGILLVAEV